MNLTKGEFSLFNLKTRIVLLNNNGKMLIKKQIDAMHEIQLFLMHDFYVEVFFDFHKKQILKAEPVLSHNYLQIYFGSYEP